MCWGVGRYVGRGVQGVGGGGKDAGRGEGRCGEVWRKVRGEL